MPSMIGCHALVFTGEFDTRGIASSVQRARAAGFDLIEFPLMEPDTFDSGTARRTAEAEGLHITASLGLPLEADISSDDPSIVAAGHRLLDVALDRTAEMGGSHMCGVLVRVYAQAHGARLGDRSSEQRRRHPIACQPERRRWVSGCRWRLSTATRAT